MNTIISRLVVISLLMVVATGCSENAGTVTGPETDDQEIALRSDAAAFDAPWLTKHLTPGDVVPFLSLPYGQSPEGIAIDAGGTMYLSVRERGVDGAFTDNLVLKIDPYLGAGPSAAISLGPATASGLGVLGLVTDKAGDVYVAFDSKDPATHGVWRIARNGFDRTRLPGSENIDTPNALAVDQRGSLYVSDCFDGKIWRYRRDGDAFEVWMEHKLLLPILMADSPIVQPGANGIAFGPGQILHVANTARGMLLSIQMNPDGTAGLLEITAAGPALASLDGIVLDQYADVFGVLPASMVMDIAPVAHMYVDTGSIVSVVDEMGYIDWPTSLAFGRGVLDNESVFVVNSDLFGDPTTGFGPGVVQVGVGMKGLFVP